MATNLWEKQPLAEFWGSIQEEYPYLSEKAIDTLHLLSV